MEFTNLFRAPKPILAMLHLKGEGSADVLTRAMRETEILVAGGADGLVVEDYFGTADDVAAVLAGLAADPPPIPYGVNILDDGPASFELADKFGAGFVQMDSVAGHLLPADDAVFAREVAAIRAASDAVLLGGVRFKYQKVLSGNSLQTDLRAGMDRCDALVVTGDRTGEETPTDKILAFREVLGAQFPLVIGAGVTVENCAQQMPLGDAVIVGSALKVGGVAEGELSPAAVTEFVSAMREVRERS